MHWCALTCSFQSKPTSCVSFCVSSMTRTTWALAERDMGECTSHQMHPQQRSRSPHHRGNVPWALHMCTPVMEQCLRACWCQQHRINGMSLCVLSYDSYGCASMPPLLRCPLPGGTTASHSSLTLALLVVCVLPHCARCGAACGGELWLCDVCTLRDQGLQVGVGPCMRAASCICCCCCFT